MAYLFLLFRVTIHLSVRLLLRVLNPRVGWPQGVTGWRPPEVLPSPPPWGWSTGFIVTPRLCGRLPSQRVRPALPSETFSWSTLPTCPTVAMHSRGTRRTSPEGSLSSAEPPSLETNCACEPADRAICAPFPGLNSMLWTIVPAGIFFMGMALPTRMSASGPDLSGLQTGKGAIELCRQVRPDLILLDIMLPDSDGLDICKGIRRDPDLAGVPIIFLT